MGHRICLAEKKGLQAKVLTENPKALYLYCFGHQLNLVVQDSLKAIPEVAIALERMHAVVQFIKNSPKKWDRFKSIVNSVSADDLSFPKDNHMLRPLCTTRWVMRLPAVDTFLVHYHEILEFLESIKEDYTELPTIERKLIPFCVSSRLSRTTSASE